MGSFRDHLTSTVEALFKGDWADTVVYNGSEIRAIIRKGRTGTDGTGFGSDGSSTEGTLRIRLSDVDPCEGDEVVEADGKVWSVVREISRSMTTALLEIRTDRSFL
ncbi:hypothetical protein L2W58_00155 [Dethiosulfovibrio sp. F2B]|uniref:Uncharacterized protein n=1 Tax=Dethiosulfovibrio peptidovorans DSM 11002 TaxID=469381 RepID=D2Z3S3_9BACT|nr:MULTISPECIES: hypothetical protein [Dethiosulfovibrio]EFC90379.1 hypothetical protein Dpep_0347 [Dethiosulfovibrio peptidovorans DSM 11002]MCF4150220.1 hypothetical protein [Dethiosulfovibrio faecalis]